MDIGEPERSGRHRLEHEGGTIWLPLDAGADHAAGPPARPAPGSGAVPAQRTRDPLVDTDAVGLRKFNIGLVPASVTPPRTWKRAAWFAVVSSAAVLVGLAYAAAQLVGSDVPRERIGMPGYPASPLITGFDTSTSAPPPIGFDLPEDRPGDKVAAHRAGDDHPRTEAKPAAPSAGTTPNAQPDQPGARPGRPGTTAAPTSSATAYPTSAPTVTTVPSAAKPLVDATTIVLRTERFFEQAVANADAAMAVVADVFRSDAEALLEQRFSDVASIQVTSITVDPATGVTVSTLEVVKKDGSTTSEQRELSFTTTGEPLITAERLVDSA